jgi:transcriptional regulator with GAF, ATPase, and Fis domain
MVAQMAATTFEDPPDQADPGDRLAAVVALRRLADRVEDAEVERALRAGWTWEQVAQALGVTRQAVHKKHAKRLADAGTAERGD